MFVCLECLCVCRSQELFQVAFVVHNVSVYSLRVKCAVDQGKGSSRLQVEAGE